jgi:hypothetical protein
MHNLTRSHKTVWSFNENRTIISLDICRLTIHLETGTERTQDAMGFSESFETFLNSKNTIHDYINSYSYFENHLNEIKAAVSYYNSDDYFRTLTPEELANFEKYNPKKAVYIKVHFPQLINFKESVDKIETLNKRSIYVLAGLILLLLIPASIWSYYNIKAIYFLVPCMLFSLFLISIALKTKGYKPKYGKAEILEVYQSFSTVPSKNFFPPVYFAKVKAHKLYEFKNGVVAIENFQDVECTSYQISTNFFENLKDKKSVIFITRGKGEIFEIINSF